MIQVEFDLVGMAPYSPSGPIQSKKRDGEAGDSYERRTWRERIHVDQDGIAFIPPQAIKNCLSDVARFLSESVPGKGKSTYTKHFEAGVMVIDPLSLNVKGGDIEGETLFVPSDGRRGGGKRVWKTFPFLPKWEVHGSAYLLDPILIDKPQKVKDYLEFAGKFIGIGRFRPRNNGYYGRFEVRNFQVVDGKGR